MKVIAKMAAFLSISGGYRPVGSVEKELDVNTTLEARKEACELVRRNRMSNPGNPGMRYGVERFVDDRSVWKYDETEGDPLLIPTADTSPSCPR